MNANITAANSRCSAILDLECVDNIARNVYCICKFTYAISGNRCVLVEPLPLEHDLRDPNLIPRMPPGTDFWSYKERPDFAVKGSAFAQGGQAVTQQLVEASVGDVSKRIAVFGDRAVTWGNGREPLFGSPEPFTELPLTWDRAYGGLDWRVPPPEPLSQEKLNLLQFDHPGMYPRNPWGRGYLVERGEVPDMLLPNLEDPGDLITPERLITGDPRLWWRQPVPWTFDFMSVGVFPRMVTVGLGADAWYPGPDDSSLPEVSRGWLIADWRKHYLEGPIPSDDLRQEASHGLTLSFDPHGAPVRLAGMHPARPELVFSLPEDPPHVEFTLEGQKEASPARLHNVVCYPGEELVTLTYGALADLPRPFVPGVHKHIPVSVSIDGDIPIKYRPPMTQHEDLRAALARHAAAQS